MPRAVRLRSSDLAVLVAQLQDNMPTVFGSSLGSQHTFTVRLELLTLGIPRAILSLLAGIPALFPLYLLRLTFSGRNRYWRYLGLAFLFLLPPTTIEALTYLGNILADYNKLPQLGVLTNFSILQGLATQLGWDITIFPVVDFATVGLQGIATQFNLIRNHREQSPTMDSQPNHPSETIADRMKSSSAPDLLILTGTAFRTAPRRP